MTSSLALLAGGGDGGRFGVSNIVGVSLITCEDSDSGAYLKDNSRLKSIISHDAIGVERKNKGMFDYTPHALIVCAANDIPKTRDKGDAWLARNIYVPFTGQFVGKADDKTIRSEWVVSPEFCEYLAYQALVKWDRYYELPEPEEAAQLKREWFSAMTRWLSSGRTSRIRFRPTSCRMITCPCATTNGWPRSTRACGCR